MDPTIAVIAVLLIVALVLLWYTIKRKRTDALRDKFGDEYDRTVEDRGNRGKAEADLADRQRRVDALDIRPLSADERKEYSREWTEVKSLFVDSPAEAVLHADRMLTKMMRLRGFPMGDFDRRYEDLTVDHAEVARHYREGHQIVDRHGQGNASTEDLRQAMKHYELLFEDMVTDGDPAAGRDLDRDGVPDRIEGHDRDRDGISDRVETRDRDRDGVPDRLKIRDRDGDGGPDRSERPRLD